MENSLRMSSCGLEEEGFDLIQDGRDTGRGLNAGSWKVYHHQETRGASQKWKWEHTKWKIAEKRECSKGRRQVRCGQKGVLWTGNIKNVAGRRRKKIVPLHGQERGRMWFLHISWFLQLQLRNKVNKPQSYNSVLYYSSYITLFANNSAKHECKSSPLDLSSWCTVYVFGLIYDSTSICKFQICKFRLR